MSYGKYSVPIVRGLFFLVENLRKWIHLQILAILSVLVSVNVTSNMKYFEDGNSARNLLVWKTVWSRVKMEVIRVDSGFMWNTKLFGYGN